jgi:Taurine catabolism dioxygenase TauD, TfdA family/Gamma-butyrobetaine hydroxylase-like, N-terminal
MSSAELHDDFIRVIDGDHHADFHLRWLRHNCDGDRHALTGERSIDSAELPDRLDVAELTVVDQTLRVRWRDDDRVSRYSLAWLHANAYAVDRVAAPPPPSNVARLELLGGAGPEATADAALARLETYGAAVIRRSVLHPERETEAWIAAFGTRGLELVSTHFGRIEDLRTDNTTNAHTDQLGYTDAAIGLHTDQPFLTEPPRYQLLQSIRRADRGGESLLADARAAYRYLESIDRDAAARLVATPVRFHRRQRGFERDITATTVAWSPAGEFRVRASYFTEAPYRVEFADMAAWYRARDRFVRILRDERYHYRLRLDPGDVLVYDNHRMVHGRTAFSGPRWVRGVYFDRARDVGRGDARECPEG